MELLHQMCHGEGFGKIVGKGIKEMKQIFIEEYGADPDFYEGYGYGTKGP